jgi:hypothetical protein
MMPEPDRNPFSTCYVRPGRLAFQFSEDCGASQLTERLADLGGWGQIVGPHGAGKSTLLHAWLPQLAGAGRDIVWWTLHAGERHLPTDWQSAARDWGPDTLVVVDGYEQLSWWSRRTLQSRCRRARCGLLVTTHHDAGLPDLLAVRSSLEIVQTLVAELTRGMPKQISPAEVATCFHACQGNVRDLFFALYDLYERRRA